jgi:hypothetical protein
MKETLTTSEIAHKLRQDENAGWSYDGALALAEYLEELETDTGQEMEFDRVAIRCDFSEYEGLRQWAEDYFGGISQWESALRIDPDTLPDECDDRIREYINDRGTLIEFDGGIIVGSF